MATTGEMQNASKSEIAQIEELVDFKDDERRLDNNESIITDREKTAAIRAIDIRITIVLGVMFCVSLMDRTNLGAAAIAGMTKDLHLQVGARYSLVALLFFIPYILFEFPGTLLARAVGPRMFLAAICMLWGVVMLCFGFVKRWEQLMGLRVLLGTLEAAFFPACIYLLSSWYTRYEIQKRFAVFFLIASSASAFAGILAYGLMQMDGVANLEGWRWIFIIEGILTVAIGIAGGYCLVDFPDKVRQSRRFLSPEQLDWIKRRLQLDHRGASTEKFTWGKFFAASGSLPVWLYGMVACCTTTVSYCVAFFLPILLHGYMGFDVGKAQCLVAPPYVFAAILMYSQGYVADKHRLRGPVLVFNAILAIIGLAVLGWTKSAGIRYFGVFFITGGAQANVPAAMAYMTNNVVGNWQRAFSSAAFVGGGGIGGIAGSLIFRSQDAPRYLNGIYGCIAANLVIIAIVSGLSIFFKHENRLANRKQKILQGLEGFRYTL